MRTVKLNFEPSLAVRIAGWMLRIGQIAVRHDAKVLDFKLIDRAWKGREEVLPILLVVIETNVLARRCHVENKQLGARHVSRHDGICILGAESRSEPVLKRPDFLLVVFCGTGARG